MNYTEEQITTMVADKCREVLAPLYVQIEALRTKYYPTEPKIEQPTPEELEEAELAKQKKHFEAMADRLREQGLIK